MDLASLVDLDPFRLKPTSGDLPDNCQYRTLHPFYCVCPTCRQVQHLEDGLRLWRIPVGRLVALHPMTWHLFKVTDTGFLCRFFLNGFLLQFLCLRCFLGWLLFNFSLGSFLFGWLFLTYNLVSFCWRTPPQMFWDITSLFRWFVMNQSDERLRISLYSGDVYETV